MARKILVLFAHPAFHKSKVNKILVEGMEKLEGVTFHDLYEAYPEFDIDVEREQQLMETHDVVVFQFPFFWYSTPAILKEWQDMVLKHGWAYGSKGLALKDKLFFCVTTTGGPKMAYSAEGFHGHTMNEFLVPLKRTAILCKMKPLPPYVVHGSNGIDEDEVLDARAHYHQLLARLASGELKPEQAEALEYLNDYVLEEV